MMTEWLVDGWQQRTQQKIVFAGCLAALLSLRNDPLRRASRLLDFGQKLVGYGGASVVFSGIQETCRALRGRHDFLNSAFSGAVTGALVVGHYQGPQYRLLGVVTWGSLGAVLHIANSVLQPRYYLEDYLVREGLLSPEATRYRQALSPKLSSSSSETVGIIFPELEHRDIMMEAKAVREREMRQLNGSKVTVPTTAATVGTSTTMGKGNQRRDVKELEDVADDDPGYQAWLRTSGFQADALLLQPQSQQLELQLQPPLQLAGNLTTGNGDGDSEDSEEETSSATMMKSTEAAVALGSGEEAEAAPQTATGRSWSIWLKPWKWRSRKAAGDADEEQRSS